MNKASSITRRHGLRFSMPDALVLMAGAVLSWWLAEMDFPLWWVVPAAVGHFFLFCNVFLVWRRWELLWAGVFILNVCGHLAFGQTEWMSPVLLQLPFTVLVITWQTKSPWYHGIGAERLNPRTREYLNGGMP